MKPTIQLLIGKTYLTPSGLGGIFQVKYIGKFQGKYRFENVSPQWEGKGSMYTYSKCQLEASIREQRTPVSVSEKLQNIQ